MIIFYNKHTGKIYGTIDGRIHDKHQDMWIQPSSVEKKDIAKKEIKYKKKTKIVEEPKFGFQLIDEKKKIFKKVKIGTKMVKRGAGLEIDEPQKELIEDFEKGKKIIYDYKVKLKNGKVEGFEKK